MTVSDGQNAALVTDGESIPFVPLISTTVVPPEEPIVETIVDLASRNIVINIEVY